MSKKMLVSSNQTDAVRDMANAKGVTRAQFQAAQDDGRIARFLDTLKVDPTALTPPPGARPSYCSHPLQTGPRMAGVDKRCWSQHSERLQCSECWWRIPTNRNGRNRGGPHSS